MISIIIDIIFIIIYVFSINWEGRIFGENTSLKYEVFPNKKNNSISKIVNIWNIMEAVKCSL
jgi:hypothetical protein